MYADMFGWEERVRLVAGYFHSLPPEERKTTAIGAPNYGQAGAIDFFGREYNLPPAVSGHNNYWLWGLRGRSGEVMIVVGGNAHDHGHAFAEVDSAAFHSNPYAMPYETNLTIFVCRRPRLPMDELWTRVKSYR